MGAIAEDLRRRIITDLTILGITSYDGEPGPVCQNGETYREIIISASSVGDAIKASVGAVLGFCEPGDTIYWRIRPEYDEAGPLGSAIARVYMRFACSPAKAKAA
jgi:hypothetical protein